MKRLHEHCDEKKVIIEFVSNAHYNLSRTEQLTGNLKQRKKTVPIANTEVNHIIKKEILNF